MALIRLLFDRLGIERRDFDYLFSLDDNFYIAVMNKANGLYLRTSPFARSSMVIKGPKYTKSLQIARKILFEMKPGALFNVYTIHEPKISSYAVSGFEALIKPNEKNETAEQKISLLKQAWELTVSKMKAEGIEIWSK